MNILTKICVVLLVVASLVAAVVFVNLAVFSANYRYYWEQEREAYRRLEKAYGNVAANEANLSSELAILRQKRIADTTELRKQIDTLSAQKSALAVEKSRLENEISNISDKLLAVEKTLKAQQEINNEQRQDLQEAWDAKAQCQEQLAQAQAILEEEQAKSDRLEKNLKVVSEQNTDLRAQLKELNQRLAAVGGGAEAGDAAEVTPVSGPKITGTIQTVSDNLASINVGSAHGVKEGMQLIVYRGAQFVGYLKVETVRVNESAGVMVTKKLEPIQGDKVTSSLN